jgi:hypothetical protein
MRFPKTTAVFSLLAITVLLSCQPAGNKQLWKPGFSKLKVIIDTGSVFYLDSIRLSAPWKYTQFVTSWDTTMNTDVYVFDSVQNGELSISLVSFLSRTCDKKIILASDTTIFVSKNDIRSFSEQKEGELPDRKLSEGDTLVVGLRTIGCFGGSKQCLEIVKSQGMYHTNWHTTWPVYSNVQLKNVHDSSYSEKLDKFYRSCEKVVMRPRDTSFWHSSTLITSLYIRKGNLVYPLPDEGEMCSNPYYALLVSTVKH